MYFNYCKQIIYWVILLMPVHQAFGFDLLNTLQTIQQTMPNANKSATTASNNQIRDWRSQTNQQITYEDYSKDFQAVKKLIAGGQMSQAYQIKKKAFESEEPEFLNSVELGLLAMDTANSKGAVDAFFKAERHLKEIMGRSVIEDGVTDLGTELISAATGIGDLTEYKGEPYERILMLNYKSIAYLLNGERKAYNVTRRAIDWQNIEKKQFEQKIGEVKKQVSKQENEATTDEDGEEASSASSNAFSLIFDQYARFRKKANSVKSAYINPFGYYMAGIVQEFDSFEDSSLRDNARISYKKAADLNPRSKVIKQSVKQVAKRPPRNKRLVHVIAADGFAPEKKTFSFMLPVAGQLISIKTPLFEPVPSAVKWIVIKSGKKTLATLSPIADIEAITLRHQMDMLPVQRMRVMASIGRNIGENMVWNSLGAFGSLGKMMREDFANPDMRAWMSLPKQISAARFYVSKWVKNIKIISYDKRWRVLATKKVKLNKKSHNFIYVRSIEKSLNAQINKKLWVN